MTSIRSDFHNVTLTFVKLKQGVVVYDTFLTTNIPDRKRNTTRHSKAIFRDFGSNKRSGSPLVFIDSSRSSIKIFLELQKNRIPHSITAYKYSHGYRVLFQP